MQSWRNRMAAVWIAPLAVGILLSGCFATAGLFPFGNNTLSWCDMNHQAVPLLMDFQDILAGKASMFLNLQNAGGMDFWGVFFFFLSSPFSFIAAAVPKADFYLLMNVLVMLKLMLSACTAAILFVHVFPYLNVSQISCFAAMYACSGFSLMYYQNIMWLDTVCLFPLLVLGIKKLCAEEKPALFLLMLCAMIVVNYYLSAMVLFWLVLLFAVLASVVTDSHERNRKLVLVGLCTVAALMITAVIWMPSFLQYLRSGREVSLFASLSSGSFWTDYSTTLPILFCTGAAVAAIPLYFLSGKKSPVRKILFITLLFLLVPLLIDPIDRMWHLGSYQAFPVRFGYIIVLTGLLLTGEYLNTSQRLVVSRIQSNPLFLLVACAGTCIIPICGAHLLAVKKDVLTHYTQTLWNGTEAFKLELVFSVVAICLYLLLFLGFHYQKLSKCMLCLLLCILTASEICFYTGVYVSSAANNGHTYQSALDLGGRVKDSSLYRMKTDQLYFDTNLMGSLGYPVLDHYTSLTNGTYMDTMQKMGYSSHWMESHSSGGTVLTDSILAQKYSIARNQEGNGRSVVYRNRDYSIVRQPYSLPFGFTAQKLGSTLKDGDRFAAQDTLYHTLLGGQGPIVTRYNPTELDRAQVQKRGDNTVYISAEPGGSLFYHIFVKGKTTLYFDCYNHASRDISSPLDNAFRIYVNGMLKADNYPNGSFNGLVDLGTFTGQEVEIRVEVLHDVDCSSFGVAGICDSSLEEVLQRTEKANIQARGNTIAGTVSAKNGGWLVLPMRGGKGFTATVNGEKAQTGTAVGMFLAVKLKQGQNLITIQYVPPGWTGGIVCSVIGVLAVILLLLMQKKKWLNHLYWLEKPAQVVFAVIAAIFTILLYVFPVAVYLAKNVTNYL